ncbi:SMEK domain-containing protein [Microbacterium sp. S1037]|uniref:SMEK domain-containing protein n=1 Tax=Microbacterium sp. S1037 TaxID=3398227 RepID=UPI003AADC76D
MRETDLAVSIADRAGAIGHHVLSLTDSGFNDAAKGLETLYREILNMTRGWALTSTNFETLNSAAIDLHDTGRRIAVQVTARLTSRKVKKTVEVFLAKKLDRKYDTLHIVGIEGIRQSKHALKWVTITHQESILSTAGLTLRQLEKLDERLGESVPWTQFTQRSDFACFEVVLSTLNRDAIRHSVAVEADFGDMLRALRQIKQMVTVGKAEGIQATAKAASAYASFAYREQIEMIDEEIGRMTRLVRKGLVGDNLLPPAIGKNVDGVRESLVDRVNRFSEAHGHHTRIQIQR